LDTEQLDKVVESACVLPYSGNKDNAEPANEASTREPYYVLPDGVALSVEARSEAAETWFDTIVPLVNKTLDQCDVSIREMLRPNSVSCGALSQMPGVAGRLAEVVLSGRSKRRRTVALGVEGVWVGASIIGSLSTFQSYLILKEEFDECGPQIVHRKCIM